MPYSVYECDGYDKYNVEKEQRSTDGGVTWDDTGNTRMGNTLIEANSTDCGYSGETEEWRTESDAYLCDNGNKYQSEIRYYWDGEWKTDGERRTGTLIESNSTECTGLSSDSLFLFQVCDKTNYECVNNVKIYKATKKISQDGGIVWTQQGTSCSIDTRGDSVDSCTILTRWVTVPNEYECSGYDKYNKEKEQISTNGGTTWTDTGNTRIGSTLIEANSTDCGYVPTSYETQYLTTEILGNGTIQLATYVTSGTASTEPLTNIKYSKNNGTWTSIQYGQNINVVNGDVIRWKSDAYVSSGIYSTSIYGGMIGTKTRFVSDVNFNVYGNIKSLLYSDNFLNNNSNSERYDYLFCNSNVIDASNLILSENMANTCYQQMFFSCDLLTNAPSLPATTLTSGCYSNMFGYCSSLTTAPQLPATTLQNTCYSYMFRNCTSLTTAPELPATTLTSGCYSNMFYGCTNLNYIKAMFTTTPSSSYTTNWVRGVASSGTFVKNSAASWSETGDNGIPSGWTIQTASE